MKKKLIMILLSAVMIFAMMPAMAFADSQAPTIGDFTAPTYVAAEAPAVFVASGNGAAKSIKYTWKAVDGAEKYVLWQSVAGKAVYKEIAKTNGTSYTKKGLKKGTAYEAFVVACDAEGEAIAQSVTVYTITKGGKYSNAKKVSATKSVTVVAGKTKKLTAKVASKDSKSKLLNKCAAIRFISTDEAVATVSAKGVVTGVTAGTCKVYAIAPNGKYAVTSVTVTAAPVKIENIVNFALNFSGSELAIPDSVKVPHATWADAAKAGFKFSVSASGEQVKGMVDEAKAKGVSLGNLEQSASMLGYVQKIDIDFVVKADASGNVTADIASCNATIGTSVMDLKQKVNGSFKVHYDATNAVVTTGQYNTIESGHKYLLAK